MMTWQTAGKGGLLQQSEMFPPCAYGAAMNTDWATTRSTVRGWRTTCATPTHSGAGCLIR